MYNINIENDFFLTADLNNWMSIDYRVSIIMSGKTMSHVSLAKFSISFLFAHQKFNFSVSDYQFQLLFVNTCSWQKKEPTRDLPVIAFKQDLLERMRKGYALQTRRVIHSVWCLFRTYVVGWERPRWEQENEKEDSLVPGNSAESGAITFLTPRFRAGVPWVASGWVARKYR